MALTPPIQIVWFRRDLRVADHATLHDAARCGPVLPLYVVDPARLREATFGTRHWVFVRECLLEVDAALRALGQPLRIRVGRPVAVLDALADEVARAERTVGAVWAMAEPGRRAAARDEAVGVWAAGRGIGWRVRAEEPAPGRTTIPAPNRLGGAATDAVAAGELPTAEALGLAPDGLTDRVLDADGLAWLTESGRRRVAGGARAGAELLASFLAQRGQGYGGAADDPAAASLVCSRIGAHLAWGALSTAEVHAVLRAAEHEQARRRGQDRAAGHGTEVEAWRASMGAFRDAMAVREAALSRFAARPDLEPEADDAAEDSEGPGGGADDVESANGGRTGGRTVGREPAGGGRDASDRLDAWVSGRTGRPLIDAAMAQLRAIGWLPYRLRAVTTSYAVHDLGLPWPVVGWQLARLCLDYDPALLWPTVRRIAGALDAAGPRIYNPDRQALALDPAGHYVRAWLPPLAAVPDSFVHSPWLMPEAMQTASGCTVGVDVPAPIEVPRGVRAAGRAVRAPGAHRPAGEPDDRAADGPVQLPLVD